MTDKWALTWEQTDLENGKLDERKKVFNSENEMESFIREKKDSKKIAEQVYPTDLEFRIKKKGKLNEVV